MFLKNYNYLVCYCVNLSIYPSILSIKNNTVQKKSAVLMLCYVLPVRFAWSSFSGCTNVSCPRNMNFATWKIHLNTFLRTRKNRLKQFVITYFIFFLVLLLLDDTRCHIRRALKKSVWRYKYWITKSIVGRLEPSEARREDLKKETQSRSLLTLNRGGLCEHYFTNRKRTSKRVKCIAL